MTGLPSCVHDADHRGTLRGEVVVTSRACGRGKTLCKMGVSENVVYPEKPNGFADHYPYSMAISLGIYPIFRQTQIIPWIKFNVTYDDVFAYMHALHIPPF